MGHHLGLATKTQITVCKSPFPSAGTAVSVSLFDLIVSCDKLFSDQRRMMVRYLSLQVVLEVLVLELELELEYLYYTCLERKGPTVL